MYYVNVLLIISNNNIHIMNTAKYRFGEHVGEITVPQIGKAGWCFFTLWILQHISEQLINFSILHGSYSRNSSVKYKH